MRSAKIVLVAVVAVGHRAGQVMPLVDGLVVSGAVLNSTVRMVYQWLPRLARAQCHLQRLAHLLRLQAVMDVVAHDLSRVGVRDQAQIDRLPGGGKVRNVGNPDLFGRIGHYLLRPILEQVRVAPEAVMAMCGLVIGPKRLHQQPGRTQNVEQPVTAHPDILLLQRSSQDLLQLASAHAWLAQPHLGDQGANTGIPSGLLEFAVATLVVRLPADANVRQALLTLSPWTSSCARTCPKAFLPCEPRAPSGSRRSPLRTTALSPAPHATGPPVP